MSSQISIAFSTAGRLSIQRWPQKGKAKVLDRQKSSLLASTLWKPLLWIHIWQHYVVSVVHNLPQLRIKWAPPKCFACSICSFSKKHQLMLGPSMNNETILLKSSSCKHSYKKYPKQYFNILKYFYILMHYIMYSVIQYQSTM